MKRGDKVKFKVLRNDLEPKPLKPCPFCGQAGKIVQMANRQYYSVCAGDMSVFCLLQRKPDLNNGGFILKDDAIAVWNNRNIR